MSGRAWPMSGRAWPISGSTSQSQFTLWRVSPAASEPALTAFPRNAWWWDGSWQTCPSLQFPAHQLAEIRNWNAAMRNHITLTNREALGLVIPSSCALALVMLWDLFVNKGRLTTIFSLIYETWKVGQKAVKHYLLDLIQPWKSLPHNNRGYLH